MTAERADDEVRVGAGELDGHGPVIAALRARPGFTLLFATLLVLFVAPVYVPDFLPFIDYGPHLAEISALLHYEDPAWAIEPYYVKAFSEQYAWQHAALVALARLTGPALAYRLFVTAYLVLAPLATLAILLRLRRSPWPAVLSFAALYGYPLSFGFIHHCVGTAGVLLCCYGFERWDATRSWRPLAALAAGSLVLFALHPYPLLYWAGAGPLLALLSALRRRGGYRHVATLAATAAPGLGLVVWFTLRHPTTLRTLDQTYPDLARRFADLPLQAGAIWTDPTYYLVGFLFAGLILLALLWPREPEAPEGWRDALWRRRYLVLAAALLLGGLVGPEHFQGQSYIASRFPAMAALVAPLALSDARAWRQRIFPALASAIVAGLGLFVLLQMATFRVESAGFRRVVDAVPQGARVRCQIDDLHSPLFVLPVYRHFCSYVLAERGGLNGFIFRKLGLEYREPYRVPLGLLYFWQHAPTRRFDFAGYGDLYDFYVVRSREERTPYDVGGRLAPYVEPVTSAGVWRLYRRVRPFADAPPGALEDPAERAAREAAGR